MLLSLLNSENNTSNAPTKRTFSSANCTLLLCFSFTSFFCLWETATPISSDLISYIFDNILLIIMLIGFWWILSIKFPLFIDEKPVQKPSKDSYDKKYTQNLGWFKCLCFSLFTAEKSNLVSLFSGATITMYEKDRICKFTWENKPVKSTHRTLDFVLLLTAESIFCALMTNLFSFNFLSGFCFLIIGTTFLFRKKFLFFILSINVGKCYGYKLNVIYPYKEAMFLIYKYFGTVEPLTKTILITENTYRLDPIIREYVTAHEAGHLKDKKTLLTQFFMNVIVMVYFFMIPHLIKFLGIWIVIYSILIYFIFKMTIGCKIDQNFEFSADSFALKKLGKQKCIEALKLMNKNLLSNEKNNFGKKNVALENQIHFINNYKE